MKITLNKERDFFGLVLCLLLGACMLWRAPLSQSLWLDETVSVWISGESFARTVSQALQYQGESPFYFLILRTWRVVLGSGEASLRILSLLFVAGTILVLVKFSRRLRISQPWSFVILPFLAVEGVLKAGLMVRPYALALFLSTLSLYLFYRYLKERCNVLLLLSVGSFVATFYAHYLFIGIVGVAVVFFLQECFWQTNAIRLNISQKKFLVFVLLIGALLCLPGLLHLFALHAKKESYEFLTQLNVRSVVLATLPLQLLVYVLVSFTLVRIFWGKIDHAIIWNGRIGTLLFWWLFPGIMLTACSLMLGTSLLADRYYIWRAPGLALLLGYLLSRIPEAQARRLVLITFCFAGFFELSRIWNIEDWKRAAQFLNTQEQHSPVFLYSGLIELEGEDWDRNHEREAYLGSPFQVYPVEQKVHLLSTQIEREEVFSRRVSSTLGDESEFYLVVLRGLRVKGQRIDQYLLKSFKTHQCLEVEQREFGLVQVYRMRCEG